MFFVSDKTRNLLEPDVFDILSATWVFSCNDENPIITFEGLEHRLQLKGDFDIRKLVRARSDLFRQGIPMGRLERWKTEMLQGKRVPVWLSEEKDANIRRSRIESIRPADGFRSQFRATDGAEQSKLEVITWGLQHIDRLRKAHWDAEDKRLRNWQVGSVIALGLLNLLATFITRAH